MLATTHDGDVRIWDLRKGNAPVRYISAHLSKINGLDWSPVDGNKLITCSLDKTVKLWDIFEDTRNAKAICDHRAPVWRAKYTPPGNAILTVPLSTASQRTVSVPSLWNTNLKNPFQTFHGNSSILEFHWRFTEGEDGFQLLTWSKDQVLKLWNLDPRRCLPTAPQETREEHPLLSPEVPEFRPNLSSDDVGIESSTSSDSLNVLARGKPNNLEGEITQACNTIHDIVLEEVDITNRSCTISVKSGSNNLKMNITFPELYPENAIPSFEITDDTPVDSATKVKIREILRENAQSCLINNERCLERCLNSLITFMEGIKVHDNSVSSSQLHQYPSSYTSMDDLNAYPPSYSGMDVPFNSEDPRVPFPQMSGATFSANGLLVCFNRSSTSLKRKGEQTPRSLSAFFAHNPRNLSFFNAEALKTGIMSNKDSRKALVILRDVSSLMTFDRSLGQSYTILRGADPKEICERNRKAAVASGRADLVQTWSILGLIMDPKLKPSPSESETPWASHPFGRKLLDSLLDYYNGMHDIQMLAMISCLLEYQSLPERFIADVSTTSPDDNLQNVRNAKNFGLLEEESPSFEEALPSSHSPFYSLSPDFTIINFPVEEKRKRHENNCRFIQKEKRQLFDHYKLCYADLLYKWELSNKRSEVLKFVSNPPRHVICEKELQLRCPSGHGKYSGSRCKTCKTQASIRCVICRIAVKGAFNFCLSCGHGGHTLHIMKWFETKDVCATGCGCHCLTESQLSDSLP
ncbi:GATOR complex protein WDR59-like isoform X1 [Dendronephthya gigantea]|uniref:GATOR complex protein WDR59-like isoform X1 n=1 Tax=Dendronephthya gigantea TaxID=151771 RepID=UPI00106CCE8C|nr:GATOR complex protein WDR59-like isoform X1 [Dendronephthya gigantea]